MTTRTVKQSFLQAVNDLCISHNSKFDNAYAHMHIIAGDDLRDELARFDMALAFVGDAHTMSIHNAIVLQDGCGGNIYINADNAPLALVECALHAMYIAAEWDADKHGLAYGKPMIFKHV